MENNKNTKIFLYIAGACFVAVAVLSVIGLLSVWSLETFLTCIAFFAVAVSLFLEKPLITVIGSAIGAAGALWQLIENITFYTDNNWLSGGYIWVSCTRGILSVLFWAMLLIAAIEMLQSKKEASVFCFVAAAAWPLSYLFNAIANRKIYALLKATYGADYGEFHYNFEGWMRIILLTAAPILLGILVSRLPVKQKATENVAPTENVHAASTESQIDRLMKLKELLDSGIITKEELEEKKKDILEI